MWRDHPTRRVINGLCVDFHGQQGQSQCSESLNQFCEHKLSTSSSAIPQRALVITDGEGFRVTVDNKELWSSGSRPLSGIDNIGCA
jgi:hypothetical protein